MISSPASQSVAVALVSTYLVGEQSVGTTNVDSTLPTSGPPASEVSRIDFHAGSFRKSSHDFFAASRLSCDST
jgi:hypothetical protein